MDFPLLEQQTRLQWRLLKHEGYYTQVHCQNVNTGEKVSRELIKGEDQLVQWARSYHLQGNLFLGRNPRNAAGDVLGITNWTLDIDPVRPQKTASTENEHSRAIAVAHRIIQNHIGGGVVCSSGNGALVIFPFTELVQDDLDRFEQQAKLLETELRDQVASPEVVLDSTYDNARLIKLLGSISTKGNVKDWRYARFLQSPGLALQRSESVLRRIRAIQIQEKEKRDLTLDFDKLSDKARLAIDSLRRLPTEYKDTYEKWLKVGMALRELEDTGLHLWETWSKDSPKYQEGICEEKWRSIENNGGLGLGSLAFWAKETDSRSGGQSTVRQDSQGNEAGVELWTPASGYDELCSRAQRVGIPTGFRFLDELTGGYTTGQVYVFSAITSAGKSVSIIQGTEAVIRAGKKALLVTTEMDKKECCVRYIALATGIPASTVQSRTFTPDQQLQIGRFEQTFRQLDRLVIQESASPRIEDLTKLVEQAKPDVVFFDYYQHVDTGVTTRAIELAALARGIGTLAKEKQIAFVVAAQLHEKFNFQTGKRFPSNKADVKDCRALNDVASVIMVIDWLEKGDADQQGPVPVRLEVEKNRHGPRGRITARLVRAIPRFENT